MPEQVIDGWTISEAPVIPKATAPPPTKTPGIGHAAYRGFVQTMAGADQLMSNISGIAAKIPNTPNFKQFSEDAAKEAERRRQELANDTSGVPQTIPEKLTEGTVSAIGAAIPYATAGPITSGLIGAAENADKGPMEALKAGAKAAAFSKASGLVKKGIGGGIEKVPGLKSAAPVVKRAATGAATAGAMGAVSSGGNAVEAGSQAIAGGLAGATQRPPKSASEVRAAKLQAATGKTKNNAYESYKVVGNALEETSKLTGKVPGTVPELLDNVQGTLTRLQTEYRKYLDPIRGQQVFGTPIADAIRQKIKLAEVNGVTKETEKIGNSLEARAKEFEKQFSVEELDNLRELYYENRTGKSSENVEERSKADVRADRIAEDAIKDLLYPMVDQEAQKSGKPAGYVRGTLKTQQAHLIQLKDALLTRKDALAEKEGIRQGTPLTQRNNITLAAHPGGGLVGSIHGLMNMIFGDPDSSKEADKRVKSALSSKPPGMPAGLVSAVVAGNANSKKRDSATGAPPTKMTPEQSAAAEWLK